MEFIFSFGVETDDRTIFIKEKPQGETDINWKPEVRKVYETDSLTRPKCDGEMRIISFIDQPDVIKKILHSQRNEEPFPKIGCSGKKHRVILEFVSERKRSKARIELLKLGPRQ